MKNKEKKKVSDLIQHLRNKGGVYDSMSDKEIYDKAMLSRPDLKGNLIMDVSFDKQDDILTTQSTEKKKANAGASVVGGGLSEYAKSESGTVFGTVKQPKEIRDINNKVVKRETYDQLSYGLTELAEQVSGRSNVAKHNEQGRFAPIEKPKDILGDKNVPKLKYSGKNMGKISEVKVDGYYTINQDEALYNEYLKKVTMPEAEQKKMRESYDKIIKDFDGAKSDDYDRIKKAIEQAKKQGDNLTAEQVREMAVDILMKEDMSVYTLKKSNDVLKMYQADLVQGKDGKTYNKKQIIENFQRKKQYEFQNEYHEIISNPAYKKGLDAWERNKEINRYIGANYNNISVEEYNRLADEFEANKTLVTEHNKLASREGDLLQKMGYNNAHLDLIKRDYDNLSNFVGAVKRGIAIVGEGVAGISSTILEEVNELTDGKIAFLDTHAKLQKSMAKAGYDWIENDKSKYRHAMSVDDIETVSDFVDWFSTDVAGTQLVNLALAGTGVGGMVAIGVSSAGNKMNEIDATNEAGDTNYSKWQKWGAGLGYGLVETGSAYVTGMALSRFGKLLKSSGVNRYGRNIGTENLARNFVNTEMKPLMKDIAKTTGRNLLEENTEEVLVQLVQNAIDIHLLGEDKSYLTFAELKDVVATTTALTGALGMGAGGTSLVNNGIKYFTSADTRIQKVSQELKELRESLQNIDLDETTRLSIEGKIREKENRQKELLTKIVDDMRKLSNEQFHEIIDIENSHRNLRSEYKKVQNDPNLTKEAKDILLADMREEFDKMDERRKDLLESDSVRAFDQLDEKSRDYLMRRATNELKSTNKGDEAITDRQLAEKSMEIQRNEAMVLGEEYFDNLDDKGQDAVVKYMKQQLGLLAIQNGEVAPTYNREQLVEMYKHWQGNNLWKDKYADNALVINQNENNKKNEVLSFDNENEKNDNVDNLTVLDDQNKEIENKEAYLEISNDSEIDFYSTKKPNEEKKEILSSNYEVSDTEIQNNSDTSATLSGQNKELVTNDDLNKKIDEEVDRRMQEAGVLTTLNNSWTIENVSQQEVNNELDALLGDLFNRQEGGATLEEVQEFLNREGKNRRFVENLSYLNPKGFVYQTLQRFYGTQNADGLQDMEKFAGWIGEIRKTFKDKITDAHEKEVFDFLMNRDLSKRFTNKQDFIEKVRAIVETLDYDSNQPLNLSRVKDKTNLEREWDNTLNELTQDKKKVEKEIDTLRERFTNPAMEGFIDPNSASYTELKRRSDEKIGLLQNQVRSLEQKIVEHRQKKRDVIRAGMNQTSLFDFHSVQGKMQEITRKSLDKIVKRLLKSVPNANVHIVNQQQVERMIADSLRLEKEQIVAQAKANGTYMKAPNGKPTNLNEEQWVTVRTEAFKDWFGDWEKQTRINKLRHSEPIINDYNGQYELNRESAKAWAKENLRGLYVNKDTKEKIEISRVGIDKVTSHGMGEVQHLKSLVSIPHLIENTIFIEERNNEKNNGKYDSYRYYVAGIKIDGEDYTAKVVIGKKGDSKYYDHELTQIEKGNLISNLNLLAKQVAENQKTFSEKSFTTAGDAPLQPYSLSEIKDTKLISILQNNSSKVVDENGEPMVVYHGSPYYGFNVFGEEERSNTMYSQYLSGSYFFTDNKSVAGNFTEKLVSKGVRVYDTLTKWITPQKIEELITSENLDNETSYILRKDPTVKNLIAFVTFSGLRNLKNKDFIEDYKNHKEDVEYDTLKGGIYEVFLNIKNPTYQEGENVSVLTKLQYEDDNTDGIIVTNADTGGGIANEYIVENPNQIKSAIANVGTFSEDSDDIRYHNVQEHKGINATFNEELAQMREGSLPSGHIFQLGRPNTLLQSAGIPNLPIEMSSTRLKTKAMQENHLFDLSEVENLPKAIQNPIGIFAYGDKSKAVNIITELQDKNGKKYLVGIHFNQDRRGLVVNDIRGIFPKDNAEWLNWISQGKGLYIDKKKVQDLITQQQTNLAEVSYLDLNSVTKVLKDFQNPKQNNNLQELRTNNGTVYGMARGNNIYLNADAGLNANTAIHEFGHLWVHSLRNGNKALYNKAIATVLRDKKAMELMRNNPNYIHLKSDEAIAEEILATEIGNLGERKYQAEQSKSVLHRLAKHIWQWVRNTLSKGTKLERWSDAKWQSASLLDVANDISDNLLQGKKVPMVRLSKAEIVQNANVLRGLNSVQLRTVLFANDLVMEARCP